MQQKRRWITLAVGVVYAFIAMFVMLYAVNNREVIIEDNRNEQMLSEFTQKTDKKENNSWEILTLSEEKSQDKEIAIPVGQGIRNENLILKNDYINRELWISIDGMREITFDENIFVKNVANIQEAVYEIQGDTVQVKLTLDAIYECRSVLEDNYLYIDLMKPKEAYERIIVVDPYGNDEGMSSRKAGIKEKEFTLDVAKRIGKKISSNHAIKVYYTRTDDAIMSVEERLQLISETEADFYIGIALNESEETSVYGVETVCNGTYFIPFFGNTQLADCVERNVTQQVSGRANGLTQAKEEDIILQKTKIPAVILKAGYLSNEKEAELLNKEEYRDLIAEGILLAVQEAYEKNGE